MTSALPPAFVGPRTVDRATYRPPIADPPCVAYMVTLTGRSADAQRHEHELDAASVAGCNGCFLAANEAHQRAAGTAPPDPGIYHDAAGHAAVAAGDWDAEQVLTARQGAERTARRFGGRS